MRKFLLSVIFIGFSFLVSFAQIPGFKGRSGYFKMPATIQQGDYVEKKVVFKLKKEYSTLIYADNINHSDFQALMIAINGRVIRKHPNAVQSIHNKSTGPSANPLSMIFEIEYRDPYSVDQVINQLYSFNLVEYAEPLYIPKLLYTPNDPHHTDQYYLGLINAYSAWSVNKGDTNIVIGIVDTGVEMTHPDLIKNIKHNYADPIDGIDNDGDGYIDNFTGWDLGEADNDPTPTAGGQHGTWVSGCAAAVPDNNDGGAGVGFNTKIMPIKITNVNGYLTAAYDGVIYAAEHGCRVINTSWGTEGAYSQYCQEIIDYVVSKGCVVVAAAGNSNNEGLFYPASYENVLSVAGTDQTDQKWIFNGPNGSNYNGYVDICAPAKAIYTTYQGGSFINIGGGTSFSSPQVAAAAALVMAQFPSYTNKQVVCQLKATVDDIYIIPFNAPYVGKMGTGRLNVNNALIQTGFPYVQPIAVHTTYGRLDTGETVDLWIDMINYLTATSGVTAQISTSNPNITIINNSSSYGSIANMETKGGATPFKIIVGNGASINELVVFEVKVTNGPHTWIENTSIRVNRDYVDVTINDLKTSVTNYGSIGYDFGLFGQGVKYKNTTSLMYEMGLMVGVDSSHVSAARDFEFYTEPTMTVVSPGESEFDVRGTFSDQSAGINALNIQINQKTLAWTTTGNSKYVIVEYCIKNKAAGDINNAYVGLYADFDIIDGKKNKAGYIAGKKLGYGYKEGGIYSGVQMLSNETANFYAINNDGSNGSININDGFSSAEQFQTLSSGTSRISATEGDVGGMMSAGPINIAKGDSVWVAFAIMGGDNLNDLITSANNATINYRNLRAVQASLIDFSDVSCYGAADGKISLELTNGVGPYTVSWSDAPGITSASATNLAKGNYAVKVKDKMKFEVTQNYVINEPSKLQMTKGTIQDVKCYGDNTGSVQLTVSGGSPNYYFDWHNSSISSVISPNLPAGTHILTLSDAHACSLTDTILVNQPDKLALTVNHVSDDTTGTGKGSVTVSLSGGTLPYIYLWDDSLTQNSSTASSLFAKTYTVSVTDKNNCPISQEVIVAGKPETNKNAVEENDPAKYNMSVFPNPATNYFFIEFELSESGTIDLSMYDESGKKVKQILNGNFNKGSYKTLVYSDDLGAGYYFYRLKTSTSSAAGKVNVLN
jgi:serine protease